MNREITEKIISTLAKQGVKRIAVFGSFARGEERGESDIDILVEFSDRKSLLKIVRIERELSEAVGRKVELLTEKAVSPYLFDRIKKEAKVIYG